MGVRLINVPDGGAVVAIARNAERAVVAEDDTLADEGPADVPRRALPGVIGIPGDEGTDV